MLSNLSYVFKHISRVVSSFLQHLRLTTRTSLQRLPCSTEQISLTKLLLRQLERSIVKNLKEAKNGRELWLRTLSMVAAMEGESKSLYQQLERSFPGLRNMK